MTFADCRLQTELQMSCGLFAWSLYQGINEATSSLFDWLCKTQFSTWFLILNSWSQILNSHGSQVSSQESRLKRDRQLIFSWYCTYNLKMTDLSTIQSADLQGAITKCNALDFLVIMESNGWSPKGVYLTYWRLNCHLNLPNPKRYLLLYCINK